MGPCVPLVLRPKVLFTDMGPVRHTTGMLQVGFQTTVRGKASTGVFWFPTAYESSVYIEVPFRRSGLRIRRCRSCGPGGNCGVGSVPGLDAPHAWVPAKKKKIVFTQYCSLLSVWYDSMSERTLYISVGKYFIA